MMLGVIETIKVERRTERKLLQINNEEISIDT